jgi:hypothetical protein
LDVTETKVSAVEITNLKLKLDILTNGRLFSFSKSPEEGGTYFENKKYGQMAFSRRFS